MQPRYVGPYKILQRVGNVAYKLEPPLNLSRIHNVFHVSYLKKNYPDPSHILLPGDIDIDEILAYEERLVKLLDRKVKELRHKQIPLVKVLWKNHGVEEATWEVEEEIKRKYPDLLPSQGMNFEDEIPLRGRGCEDSKKTDFSKLVIFLPLHLLIYFVKFLFLPFLSTILVYIHTHVSN